MKVNINIRLEESIWPSGWLHHRPRCEAWAEEHLLLLWITCCSSFCVINLIRLAFLYLYNWKILKVIYDFWPFRLIAGNLQPDQDTIANGRKSFLSEIKGLFVQLLLIAHEVGAFNLGNVSMDGSKIQADASKSKTVSYQRLLEIESRWLQEVSGLLVSGEFTDRGEKLPGGLIINEDIERRQGGLASFIWGQSSYDRTWWKTICRWSGHWGWKVADRRRKRSITGRKLGARKPVPPISGLCEKRVENRNVPYQIYNSGHRGDSTTVQVADTNLLKSDTLSWERLDVRRIFAFSWSLVPSCAQPAG